MTMQKGLSSLFLLMLGVISVFYVACKSDDTAQTAVAQPENPQVQYYMDLMEEVKATNNSVFFYMQDGSVLENPTREQVAGFFAKLTERAPADAYIVELRPQNGASFSSPNVEIGIYNGVSFGGCLTSGNVYVSGTMLVASSVQCPTIFGNFPGGAGCHSPGKCKITVKRTTAADCVCYDFVKTVITPGNYSNLGSYCCTVNYCF
ncbi:MAG: hypothetical protein IT269_00915 [Saprospiraceae bacterium]|nr:hypothetical protein [Saprospiraceae bacterium]